MTCSANSSSARFFCVGRDLRPGLRGRERGVRLVVLVLHVARVDLRQQVAGLDRRADLDRHAHDLPRGLRLHLDQVDRLDRSGRLDRDGDVSPLDRRGARLGRISRRPQLRNAAADESDQDGGDDGGIGLRLSRRRLLSSFPAVIEVPADERLELRPGDARS